MQDNTEEATIDRQLHLAVVIDKAQPLELIHEQIDPLPGCTDHLGQAFLIDVGNYRFGSAFLAKMSQHQESPRQKLLTGVEKLVDEVLFVANISFQQVPDKEF